MFFNNALLLVTIVCAILSFMIKSKKTATKLFWVAAVAFCVMAWSVFVGFIHELFNVIVEVFL